MRGIEGTRCSHGGRHIAGPAPRIDERLGDSSVDQAGVEMSQAIVGGKPLAERAFPGCGRTVNGNDHARSAPIERINSTKPGKLVAMNPLLSMRTGFSLPSPITSAAMAMR